MLSRATEPAAHYIQTGLMIQVHLDLNNYDLGHVIRWSRVSRPATTPRLPPACEKEGGGGRATEREGGRIMRALQTLLVLVEGSWNRRRPLLVNRISGGVILDGIQFLFDDDEKKGKKEMCFQS